ncbi:putative DMT superfamily transporter inner membrane protein [Streptomyces sp. YIM 130001]|uniref:DMT family transporter n=1 Tax=Streptomyces sp. YIM 130001 TaxID=2259644 RepID=UPI000E645F4D|nr:DMT family transporter [Streptomyces sp. YIM 130001]RII09202.1 putative DMT superfamily transporter inner membrane protein [Streptomyces sp. YIM 130001]
MAVDTEPHAGSAASVATTTARAESADSPAPAGLRTSALVGLLLALVATVVWSGSFVTSRALHDTVPPVQHAFWRWIIAIVAVAPFAARAAWRQRALIRRHFGFLSLAAFLGVAVYNTLVNQAGVTTPAGTMGMIMAASPVLMALGERLGGTRLGARRVTGLAIACAGVLLLTVGGGSGTSLGSGALWMAGAAVSFGSYSALLRRRPAELAGSVVLLTTFVLGALMLAPVYAVSLATQGGFQVTTGTGLPLLYVGVCSSALAFFAWNRAIAVIGAARAGLVYYLQPVCVALLSAVLLAETTGPLQWLCMALILGGVAFGTTTTRTR